MMPPGPLPAASEDSSEGDDFNVVGDEIFATFSPWASWLSQSAPTTMPVLAAATDASTGTSIDPGSAVTVTSGGIIINLLYDAAALAAPESFRAGIQQAVAVMAAAISDKITVNIKIDYSGTGGGAAAGPDHGLFQSYSSVRANLINNAAPGDTTFNALTAGSSIQGQSSVAVWNAQLKLWGLLGANDTTTDDGAAYFATDINPNLLVGVALHELTHAMGRIPYGPQPDIFDLFRFTSPGTRLFQGSATAPAAYLSLDGGNTKLGDYGRTSDSSDFLNSGVQGAADPFNEFYNGSTSQQLTTADLKQLAALGFHLTLATPGSVTISDASVAEGNSGTKIETFTVTRSGGTAAFSANFATSDGSATVADRDYTATSGTLNFASGVNTQMISVTINGDTKIEANETFFLNLSGATGGAGITDNLGIGTIINDDTTANVAPVNGVSGTIQVEANTAAAIAGLSVSDPDAASLTTILHVDHGTLSASGTGGAVVSGSGTSTLTLSGSMAQLNAVLGAANNLIYRGEHDFFGVDTLTMTTNDGGGPGGGDSLVDSDQVAIQVNTLLTGTSEANSFTALSGNERIDAGAGHDTVTFNFNLSDASIRIAGDQVTVDTAGSHTVLTGVEEYHFRDGVVNNDDGDRLVNDLFYYSQYHDIWNAHADADAHYRSSGTQEGRSPNETFTPVEYLASNSDLIQAFGFNVVAAGNHYVTIGFNENRATNSFDAVEYLASHGDLIQAFGFNPAAGQQHYVQYGFNEHRATTSFDALEYLASNGDLIGAFGLNLGAAAQHYVQHGFNEHRATTSFDAVEYLASNSDLIRAFGFNPVAGEQHYVQSGFNEHRLTDSFNSAQYLANYPDLMAAFGPGNLVAAKRHFITVGLNEGRTDKAPVIDGNSTDNTLVAKDGAVMTGGAGADSFVFDKLPQISATIADFTVGTDHLQISASGFGHGLTAGGAATLVTAADLTSASHAGSAGYFIFDNAGENAGTLYWDTTGGGGTDAIALVHLNNITSLLSSDFHIV